MNFEEIAKDDIGRMLAISPDDMTVVLAEFGKAHGYAYVRHGDNVQGRLVRLPDASLTPGQHRALSLKRTSVIEKTETAFLESYAKALHDLAKAQDTTYAEDIREGLIPRGIAGQLAKALQVRGTKPVQDTIDLIAAVLRFMELAGTMTNEGRHLEINVVYDATADKANNPANPPTLKEYRGQKWFGVLGTSSQSAISVYNHSGNVCVRSIENLNYLEPSDKSTDTRTDSLDAGAADHIDDPEMVPRELQDLNRWTNQGRRVGFSLFSSGDIAIVFGGAIQYVHRQGQWRALQLKSVLGRNWVARRKVATKLKRATIQTCLDSSFHHHGGCLAIVHRSCGEAFNEFIRSQTAGATQRTPFWSNAGKEGEPLDLNLTDLRRELLSRGHFSTNFCELSRAQRLELLNMDGATVLDASGRILAVGMILPTPVGISERARGGREAAAMFLAGFGCAFKISQDGPITLYGRRDDCLADADERSSRLMVFG